MRLYSTIIYTIKILDMFMSVHFERIDHKQEIKKGLYKTVPFLLMEYLQYYGSNSQMSS